MNALARTAGIVSIAFGLLACGGTAAPVPKLADEAAPAADVAAADVAAADVAAAPGARTAAAPAAERPSAPSEPAPAVAVSAVEAPGELVFHLRWQDPDDSVATLASYTSLPSAVTGSLTRKFVFELIKDIVRGQPVDARALAEQVLTDAPIDLAVVMVSSRPGAMPKPMSAFSIGLSSVARAREAVQSQTNEIAEGLWQIGKDKRWGKQCAIAAALGRAPARLVCGDRRRDLLALGRYLARNIAELPDQATDLRATLKLRGLFDKYGRKWAAQARGLPVFAQELKIGDPRFDDTLMDAAATLAVEAGYLIHDVDQATVELDLDRGTGLSLSLEGQFMGKRSWLVQSLIDGAHLAGPAPDIFWHLPKTSSSVSYSYQGDPQRYAGVLETLRTLLEGKLAKEKVFSASDARSIAKLLRFSVAKHAATVTASGGGDLANKLKGSVVDLLQTGGWMIYGADTPSGPIQTHWKDFVKVYNRPTVQAQLKRAIRKENGDDAVKHLPVVRTVRAPLKLGRGASAIRLTVPQVPDIPLDKSVAPSGKARDVVFHLVIMPDGARTWIGFGSDPKKVATALSTVKGSTPGPGTIANSAGFTRFRREKHNAVSRVSMGTILSAMRAGMEEALRKKQRPGGPPVDEIMALFDQLPNGGTVPLYAFVDRTDAQAPKAKLTVNVAREALEDIGFLVSKIGLMALRHRGLGRRAP